MFFKELIWSVCTKHILSPQSNTPRSGYFMAFPEDQVVNRLTPPAAQHRRLSGTALTQLLILEALTVSTVFYLY